MGKVCVCGATGIHIDYQKRTLSANGTTLNRGDYISIDGTAGEVFAGEVATAPSEIVQVLVDRSLDPKKSITYQEYAKLNEVGRTNSAGLVCAQTQTHRAGGKMQSRSGLRESDFAGRSTCSSRAIGLTRCAR